ncbi:hypothetical protein QC764_107355 [Podospora pseudoanserina]|uniref:Uncharacterized protein n=1 Tax=Podospora pseudoanserina TaxID=2609844 RepID=A0ABR0IMS2_9PEZI|nr:hypothetical protein QC764_107355 [Podospora pseudoanserina]
MQYAFFVTMGRLTVRHQESDIDEGHKMRTCIISAHLAKEVADQDVKALMLPRSFIMHQSKADFFKKSLVVIQVSWVIIECAARKVYGLPLSLLELHIMVHVVCAILMYAFWFNKPLDLQGSYEVKDRNAMKTIHRAAKETDSLFYRNHGNILNFQHKLVPKDPFDFLLKALAYVYHHELAVFSSPVLPVAYGGVHLSAWNFEFPTVQEAVIWKVSSIIIASTGPALILATLFAAAFSWLILGSWCDESEHYESDDEVAVLGQAVMPLLITPFIIGITMLIVMLAARVFLVVEVFISLRAAPLGVF